MPRSRGIYRPYSMPIMEWLMLKSHDEPGPLSTPCRIWDGYLRNGYGFISYRRRQLPVHRLAWIEQHGPVPPERPHVLHRCDRPACFADGHLYTGTHADNMADIARRGRWTPRVMGNSKKTQCPSGHPYDEWNTHVDRRGHRKCRACARERAANRKMAHA
jgi:HNH endonuclease